MLTVVFGVLTGLALGLTGGGGSVFAIPLLVFGLGLPPQQAITISLAAVTLIALTGAASAAKSGLVEYRAGTIFAVAGLLSAPAGILLANRLADAVILSGFAVLMFAVALSMWHRASRSPENAGVVRASFSSPESAISGPPCRFNPGSKALNLTTPCTAALALTGIVTGILSGLFGVGGGFIIVPALTKITQLSIQRAVATSLMVITVIGASGLFSALVSRRELDPAITGLFLAGGITGMLAGRVIAGRITGPALQKIFAAMMLAVAAMTLLSRG